MISSDDITILYVDDEEPNLFLFQAVFEKKYNVLTAISGEVGLEILKEANTQIIVVVSDMSMPEMNGLEFIRKAREQFKNIAYFILTGYGWNREIEEALQQNIVKRFFTKPFKTEEIQMAIEDFRNIKLES